MELKVQYEFAFVIKLLNSEDGHQEINVDSDRKSAALQK